MDSVTLGECSYYSVGMVKLLRVVVEVFRKVPLDVIARNLRSSDEQQASGEAATPITGSCSSVH